MLRRCKDGEKLENGRINSIQFINNLFIILASHILSNLMFMTTRCGRRVMRLMFYLPKFLFFFKHQCYPLQNSSLGQLNMMETLFPLLVAALEVFNWHGLQHVLTFLTESPMSKNSLVRINLPLFFTVLPSNSKLFLS